MFRLLASLTLLLSLSTASFAIPVLSFTGGAAGTASGDFVIGWTFTTTSTFLVDALGYYDSGQDGLANSYDVGIFDSGGSLLVSATVNSASSLNGQFRYTSIPLNSLVPGSYTILAAVASGSPDPIAFFATASTLPGISYNRSRAAPSPTLAFTNIGSGVEGGRFGPNFSATASVPELAPSSAQLPLLLAGVLLATVRIRRAPAIAQS